MPGSGPGLHGRRFRPGVRPVNCGCGSRSVGESGPDRSEIIGGMDFVPLAGIAPDSDFTSLPALSAAEESVAKSSAVQFEVKGRKFTVMSAVPAAQHLALLIIGEQLSPARLAVLERNALMLSVPYSSNAPSRTPNTGSSWNLSMTCSAHVLRTRPRLPAGRGSSVGKPRSARSARGGGR